MRKRFSESEIINLLRAIEVKISGSMGLEIVQDLGKTSACARACRSLSWTRSS